MDQDHGVGWPLYAWRVLDAVGLDPAAGVLRLSLVHYNTPAEVARIVDAPGHDPRVNVDP